MASTASKPQFHIDNDVPLPIGRSGRAMYPFGQLEVGDSFVGPAKVSFSRAANAFAARHNLKFACRAVEGGIRVWRVA